VKIQIFSDLHIDVCPIKPIKIVDDVDLVVVGGDVCEGALRAFQHLRRIVPFPVPIAMVLGNHEFYRRCLSDELALARAQAPAFHIHLLENDSIVLGGGAARKGADGAGMIRVVGATLWTDYQLFGEANQAAVMNACATGMNDHRLIRWQKQPWLRFRPQEAALLHHRSKAYIAETLATPFAGPTAVVSHHAIGESVHPRYRSDPLTGAFASALSPLIETWQPALWIHGHVHNSSDYRIGPTRIVCNPHGYADENPDFNGAMVVEVGA
jgi:hypothetical protein